jgi:hypothetical protein
MSLFLDTFDAYLINVNETKLKYVPVAVGAPDCPLEEMIGISPKKSALDLYTDAVLPKLQACRA